MSSVGTEAPVIGFKTPPEPDAVVLAACPLEELADPACKVGCEHYRITIYSML